MLTLLRYVLSTTHLHEFKSPDRIASQAPVMSLALADQKLGSRSTVDSTSHKFMLKGRQTGGMHRGHAWVFRAESYDTMLAWFSDIRNLTEKTGAERNAFIQRSHARSVSAGSHKAGSVSSDGMEEDEADQVPYSATPSQADKTAQQEKLPERPNPGGRFPSALNVNRDSQVPLSPSSNSNASSGDQEIVAAAGALPGSGVPFGNSGHQVQAGEDETNAARGKLVAAAGTPLQGNAYTHHQQAYNSLSTHQDTGKGAEYSNSPVQAHGIGSGGSGTVAHSRDQPIHRSLAHPAERHDSKYGDWMGTAAAGAGGGAIGAVGIEAYRHQQTQKQAATHSDQPGPQAVEPPTSAPASGAAGTAQNASGHPVQGAIFAEIPSTASLTEDSAVSAGQSAPAIAKGPISHTSDPAEPIKELAEATERPPLGSRVDTISDLHLPGEFPRGKSLADPL